MSALRDAEQVRRAGRELTRDLLRFEEHVAAGILPGMSHYAIVEHEAALVEADALEPPPIKGAP